MYRYWFIILNDIINSLIINYIYRNIYVVHFHTELYYQNYRKIYIREMRIILKKQFRSRYKLS